MIEQRDENGNALIISHYYKANREYIRIKESHLGSRQDTSRSLELVSKWQCPMRLCESRASALFGQLPDRRKDYDDEGLHIDSELSESGKKRPKERLWIESTYPPFVRT